MERHGAQAVDVRIYNLIEIIRRFTDFIDRIDFDAIWPIIEKIIEIIDDVFDGDGADATQIAKDPRSAKALEQLTAAGLDFQAIVQLIALIVELLKALRGGEAG